MGVYIRSFFGDQNHSSDYVWEDFGRKSFFQQVFTRQFVKSEAVSGSVRYVEKECLQKEEKTGC